jgi:GntR family transcriptional regulator
LDIRVDKGSAVPYYHQVKEAIKALIARGDLKPGDMLSSEFGLSEQLGISRLVVHRAYRELVSEGLLIRKRAKGTFVSPPAKRSSSVVGPLLSMTETLSRAGLEPSSQILVQEVIQATAEVRNELRLPDGAMVIHLRALRMAKGLPIAVEEMYFPYDRFPALAELDLNNRSIYSTLETMYAAHPQEALDLFTAGAATHEDAALLGLHKGAPVMRVRRVSTDRHGLTVEYSTAVFHADRYQFVVRLQRAV